jgi:hypothetical protein
LRRLDGQLVGPLCANLMVEIGHFPTWPLIEIRRPCNSSSQTSSTVPAFPSVRNYGFADNFKLRLLKRAEDR